MFALDCPHWSNRLRHHIFDTKPDTEFYKLKLLWRGVHWQWQLPGGIPTTASDFGDRSGWRLTGQLKEQRKM